MRVNEEGSNSNASKFLLVHPVVEYLFFLANENFMFCLSNIFDFFVFQACQFSLSRQVQRGQVRCYLPSLFAKLGLNQCWF